MKIALLDLAILHRDLQFKREAGKLADLYMVRGNPLEDIKVARDIKIVFRDGIAYDPAELLQSAEGKIGPAGPNDHADWELEIRPLRKE